MEQLASIEAKEQAAIFRARYSIEQYEQAFEKGKEWFVIELKHWIRKFESAENNSAARIVIANSLCAFTSGEVFNSGMLLETAGGLLPFLRDQLRNAEQRTLPTVRRDAILPLGSISVGEMKLQLAEQAPEIAEMTNDEFLEIMRETTTKVADLISDIDPTLYMMDTTTLSSLQKQQRTENEGKYLALLRKSDETLMAIENAPANLPHEERVKLQRLCVSIGLRMVEFQKWFTTNGFPIPTLELPMSGRSGGEKLKRFGYGKFKEKLEQLLKRDGCRENKTVASTKIARWVREINAEGYQVKENTIRAKLSEMGYSSERRDDEKTLHG
jgi:hypothetical protein